MRVSSGSDAGTDADADVRLWRALAGGGALLLAVVLAGQLYIWINLWPVRIGPGTALLWSIPQLLLWCLAIPAVARLSARLPIEGPRAAGRLLLHAAASVACAFAVLAVLDVSDRALGWSRLLGAPASLLTALDKTVLHLHIGIAIYWVVLAADHARRYYRRLAARELGAARLEAQLAEARLAALRAQLDPHFLFNTLNSIAVLVRHDAAGAEAMIGRLSALLRSTLMHAASQEVELATEIACLRDYLEIERVRFRDRLRVSFEIDPGAERCMVPNLVLQPLVENAIKHGIAPRGAPGRVAVRARLAGGALTLSVRDDGRGPGAAAAGGPGLGVGIENVTRRLECLYGRDQRFDLVALPAGGGTEARIRIPARTRGDDPWPSAH
ncbi:MAG TPA: histidine kinase [Gemmatimonadaceae bacterium]|nr:histidine kinase [Gemmatimonadaceae bacterium]